MSVSLSYNELITAAQEGFSALLQLELPMPTAMRLRRLARQVQSHLDDFNAQRGELVARYQETDADGKPVRLPDGQIKLTVEFVKPFEELLACRVDGFEPVKVADLEGGKGTVKTGALLALGDLLAE